MTLCKKSKDPRTKKKLEISKHGCQTSEMQGQGHLPEQEAKTLRKMVKFMPLDPARLLLRQTLPSHRGGHVTRTEPIRALLLRREPVSSFTEVKLGVLSGSLPPGRVAKGPSPTGERKANTERGAELRAGEGLGWSRGKAGGNEREAEDLGEGGWSPCHQRAGLPSHRIPFVA